MARIQFKIVLNFIALLMLFMAGFMLLCIPVSLYFKDNSFKGMGLSVLVATSLGAGLYFFTRNANKIVGKREGYLIVALGWLTMIILGALPYYLNVFFLSESILAKNGLYFTNAFFESVSGFTTTGATILNDIEAMPKSLLLWRSITHWIGGMGIIVLTIAILPLLGIGGMQLFVAEAPGISPDKLHPRITETAKRLWFIYFAFTVILFVLLWVSGMNVFDAINHAMSTMSTGGFSTKNASVAFWDHRPLIQYIIIFFMFAAGTNYVLFYLLAKANFKRFWRNEEFRLYLFIILFCTVLAGLTIYFGANPSENSLELGGVLTDENGTSHYSLESSFRQALFQVTSVVTTTGFISSDYSKWSPFLSVLFFALMFTGAMAGSTSGGIKMIRHLVMMKNARIELKKLLHPNAIFPLRFNRRTVSQGVSFKVLAFFISYVLIFFFGALGLSILDSSGEATDKEFVTYFSTSISTLGNVGPAFGNYSPVDNFSQMSISAKWFSGFLMLLGRLELFTILVLFTPVFWRR